MRQNEEQDQILQTTVPYQDTQQPQYINSSQADEAGYIKQLGIQYMGKEDLGKLESQALQMKESSLKTKLLRFIKLRKKQLECFNSFEKTEIQGQNLDTEKQQQMINLLNQKQLSINTEKKLSVDQTKPIVFIIILLALTFLIWWRQ